MKSRRHKKRGITLALTLACLFALTALGAATMRSMLEQQRQTRLRHNYRQAVWLAESALKRGAAQLRKSAEYQGETWKVSAETLGGASSGQAVIRVVPVEGSPQERRIEVQASFPAAVTARSGQAHAEWIIKLPESKED